MNHEQSALFEVDRPEQPIAGDGDAHETDGTTIPEHIQGIIREIDANMDKFGRVIGRDDRTRKLAHHIAWIAAKRGLNEQDVDILHRYYGLTTDDEHADQRPTTHQPPIKPYEGVDHGRRAGGDY